MAHTEQLVSGWIKESFATQLLGIYIALLDKEEMVAKMSERE